jgi:hypothetical protein
MREKLRLTECSWPARRASVALYGTGGEYTKEWHARRAAVIDRETALPELLKALHVALRALRSYEHGHVSPYLACLVADAVQEVLVKVEEP